jgi:hypothetical protein
MLRFIYGVVGIDYIGKIEQEIIEKQRRQKYLLCQQIKTGIKLKHKHPKQIWPRIPRAKPINIKRIV